MNRITRLSNYLMGKTKEVVRELRPSMDDYEATHPMPLETASPAQGSGDSEAGTAEPCPHPPQLIVAAGGSRHCNACGEQLDQGHQSVGIARTMPRATTGSRG